MSMSEGCELEARATAIRLQKRELAASCGLNKNTITNVFRGLGARTDTLKAIDAAIGAEEIRLRDHLVSLHPLPEPAREA
jgi:hypothetical protein